MQDLSHAPNVWALLVEVEAAFGKPGFIDLVDLEAGVRIKDGKRAEIKTEPLYTDKVTPDYIALQQRAMARRKNT